jgi:glucosamine 6-phosphate synthetase-like amidotransferase/phosphosugar isomerase protein
MVTSAITCSGSGPERNSLIEKLKKQPEVRARGRVNTCWPTTASWKQRGLHVIRMPEHWCWARCCTMVPLQLLAYHTAMCAGLMWTSRTSLAEVGDR